MPLPLMFRGCSGRVSRTSRRSMNLFTCPSESQVISTSVASRVGRSFRRLTGMIGKSCPSARSEEHTSELQSQSNLVCRLLLEKKKRDNIVSNALRHNFVCHALIDVINSTFRLMITKRRVKEWNTRLERQDVQSRDGSAVDPTC